MLVGFSFGRTLRGFAHTFVNAFFWRHAGSGDEEFQGVLWAQG
jgi:hypothetical protein